MEKARRLTRSQAEGADEFHRGECQITHGPRGGITETIEVWRRSGATKTWKRDPDRFRVPIKYGLRQSGYLTPENMDEFHTVRHCPLSDKEYRRVARNGQVIEINKRGGGTLGRKYDGDWDVVIYSRHGEAVLDDVIKTGTPKTHAEVDTLAFEFLDG
jgi:hypothetical protein